MAVARLNVDVLAYICDFLTDVSHILSFALTCSALHPIAIRHLLSMRPVYLTGSASIHQFHSFVFADKLARAQHIRALEIGTRPRLRRLPEATPADDDSLLIDILNLCPRLERISVVLRVRRTDDLRISDVIAAIQSLRSLSVHGKLADTVAFFHQIRAPLRMLGIHCRKPRGGHWSPAALEKFLPRFASTLEELELNTFQSGKIQTLGNIPTPSRSVFSMTQYPAVRSFSATAFGEMPLLDHLQHLFPALDGTLSLSTFGIWTNEDEFAGVRAANQRAQESERDSPPSRAWKKLDRVVCNVFMFYVLGLRCPVRLVMLDSGSAYRKRYIVAALRENPVPRLKLSLRLSHGLGVFEGLFPPELGGTLTHLTLFCEDDQYARSQGDADAATIARRRWDDLVDKMRSSLQPLHNLTHLRVVFHSSTYHADFSPDTHGEEYLRAVRGPAFELAEETVASLVCPLPSLEYIFLTTAGYLAHNHGSQVYERWHVARAWRVTEPPTDGMKDGRPVLVGLHDEVAETIIRKEELVLSKEDEEVLRKYEDRQY
ncbi:hypothetical protein LXA43DRAFT_673278 [Ganoderma leucocontextum]|nr:hypothetical protein LXA43DRAFT_673278 [Ganoderma leucocontextum]